MSNIAKVKVVIVWEHELIEAAKALERVIGEKATAEDITNAIKTCLAAIYSPELASGGCPVTVMCAHKLLQKQGPP